MADMEHMEWMRLHKPPERRLHRNNHNHNHNNNNKKSKTDQLLEAKKKEAADFEDSQKRAGEDARRRQNSHRNFQEYL